VQSRLARSKREFVVTNLFVVCAREATKVATTKMPTPSVLDFAQAVHMIFNLVDPITFPRYTAFNLSATICPSMFVE